MALCFCFDLTASLRSGGATPLFSSNLIIILIISFVGGDVKDKSAAICIFYMKFNVFLPQKITGQILLFVI